MLRDDRPFALFIHVQLCEQHVFLIAADLRFDSAFRDGVVRNVEGTEIFVPAGPDDFAVFVEVADGDAAADLSIFQLDAVHRLSFRESDGQFLFAAHLPSGQAAAVRHPFDVGGRGAEGALLGRAVVTAEAARNAEDAVIQHFFEAPAGYRQGQVAVPGPQFGEGDQLADGGQAEGAYILVIAVLDVDAALLLHAPDVIQLHPDLREGEGTGDGTGKPGDRSADEHQERHLQVFNIHGPIGFFRGLDLFGALFGYFGLLNIARAAALGHDIVFLITFADDGAVFALLRFGQDSALARNDIHFGAELQFAFQRCAVTLQARTLENGFRLLFRRGGRRGGAGKKDHGQQHDQQDLLHVDGSISMIGRLYMKAVLRRGFHSAFRAFI